MLRLGLWWCLLLPLLACAEEAVKVRSTVREADYTIGSLAQQQIDVETPRGYRLDAGSLPEKGQTDAIELRDVQWEMHDAGTITRHRIVLDWQIFVAADNTRVYPLKPLQLQFVRDGKVLAVPVAANKVIVSSLLPAKIDQQLVQPYPDVAPPPMELRAAWLALGAGLLAFVLAAIYFAHYYGWLFQSRSPMHFRAAQRDIRRLRLGNGDARLALLRLTRAFDAHAGWAVSPERLETLLAEHPEMAALAQDISAFYRDVQQVFFAGMQPSHDAEALELLARRLCRLEAV